MTVDGWGVLTVTHLSDVSVISEKSSENNSLFENRPNSWFSTAVSVSTNSRQTWAGSKWVGDSIMAKKTRGVDIRSHQHQLMVAKREADKFAARMERRKLKRGGDVVMKDKPRKKTFRYRRNMRIDGVIARNKGHAKELWKNKFGKRERPDEEMEVDTEVRSKKRRKVQARTDPDDFSVVGVDGMGLETGTMKTYMTLGSN